MKTSRRGPVAFGLLWAGASALWGALAFAQSAPGDTAAPAPAAAATGGPDNAPPATAPSPAATSTAPNVIFFPGGVAPTPPGGTLGGGNVTSSANKPRTGNEEDTFDLNASARGTTTVRGGADGPIFGAQGSGGVVSLRPFHTGPVPATHVVKRGDTLWGICETYFQNPYLWPRIWSYNPDIKNPHWIEVGQIVRLRAPGDAGPQRSGEFKIGTSRRDMPAETVFLREEGYIEDEETDTWGEITGAPEDKMFLMDTDVLYLRIVPKRSVRIGQELTLFRPIRTVGKGKLVELLGTVRVNRWDEKEHLARATVIETLDVIERGTRAAAIPRRFEVVAPVRNEKEVQAKVLATLANGTLYGKYQVVYVDKGEEDGLVVGNRLLITRKGDAWRQSLVTESANRRIALESDSPAQIEPIPVPRDEKNYPQEVVGELRVISLKKHTAMCVVSQSAREIEPNDVAIARKGY